MDLEIRKVGKKRKYYLGYSYRSEGKVKKIRIFIGTDIPQDELKERMAAAKAKLNNRIEFLMKINDPYKTILTEDELKQLKSLEPKGKIKIQHLSENDWLKFTEAFSYDTNAIEGSTVLKKEVKNILDKGKWPKKSKEEISETIGVAEAVAYLRKNREHISMKLIKELHRIVFKNSKEFAGRLRGKGMEVAVVDGRGNIVHRGAPASQVASLLSKLIVWYNINKAKYPPIILAAVVHNRFEMIHPFQDGNGRVGRLLLINILIKHGLPPLNIELKNRNQYYTALQSYEINSNIRPMIELMLKEYKKIKNILKNGR